MEFCANNYMDLDDAAQLFALQHMQAGVDLDELKKLMRKSRKKKKKKKKKKWRSTHQPTLAPHFPPTSAPSQIDICRPATLLFSGSVLYMSLRSI